MEKIGCTELLLQKPQAGYHAGPAPAEMLHLQYLYFQHIAWFCAFHVDRPRQRVNSPAIDGHVVLQRHARGYLAAARIEAA